MFGSMFSSIPEVNAPQLADWMDDDSQSFRIIDVREIQEIAQGMVPGSEPVPLRTLPARLAELDRDEKFVLVCRSGARSAQAVMFMQQNGFENVYNLRGGIMGWAGNNLPIAQPVAA
ncbi:rhodanese-like domain-containing protein [Kaarinaea lacus]